MGAQSLSVHARFPPLELFGWPHDGSEPLPPRPPRNPTWLQPFAIPPSIFQGLLDIRVPVTIAAVYLVSVIYLNRVNTSRQNRPWSFAQTSVFKYLVVLHNIFLALLSGWAFCGICHSFKKCWPSTTEPDFLVHVADTFCRLAHLDGPWDPSILPNRGVQPSVLPSLGGLWDEGCAYFTWIFYALKFYEVVDTLILIAKGKQSSILQTYHHTGVMLCAWSGVRYTSPPALIGVFLNSAIHTLMYSYFAWTSIGLPVLGFIKQALTTLQITQFVVGCAIACSYFFIEYDTLTYRPGGYVGERSSTTSTNMGFLSPVPKISIALMGQDVKSQPQYLQDLVHVQRTPCLKNSGEAFAVWLTTLYCLPLIYLFVCFFRRSYLNRVKHAN